jgi:3'(2'), 5'-bisphosphate nucleotidase
VSPTTFIAELDRACALARAGGAAVMRFYRAGNTSVQYKGPNDPVTAADHASDTIIRDGLRSAFPGDAILSEETVDSPERLASERVWIVDPLDGTKEFLAGNGEFAVMIGLAIGGAATLGVVFLPDDDALYAGVVGGGTWVERGRVRRTLRLAPSTSHAPSARAPRLVGSRSHASPLLLRIQHALGITDVRPVGSVGVKCALIAEGERDLYIHPVPYLKEWDTCAPEAVLRACGGLVTSCLGGPLAYNKPAPLQPEGFLAGTEQAVVTAGAIVAALYADALPAAAASTGPMRSNTSSTP